MNDNKGLDQADGLREEVQKETNKLPSRSELHAHKRNSNTKWKLNFPFVRLVGVLFLLIPISILAIHFNDKDSSFLDKIFTPPVKNVESISISKNVSADTAANKESEKEIPATDRVSIMETDKEQVAEGEDGKETSGPGKTIEKEEVTAASPPVETSTSGGMETEETPETTVTEEQSNVQYVEHVVQESENLFRISMKYFSSREGERIISDYNNLVNDQVNVGQKLLIPINR
ncbi:MULTISPECIES: LysM peptidoglycan-binding domain-containing protein [unclassified Sutcliffiella]|uniref:LysM peptidoglycan-binding domain-containing protein n=1 Tax=unclassified Sutcliffiella TaxID=2837532 RepID=UPI0030CF9246